MAVGEGRFLLYSRIDPPLAAGDYRFRTTQRLEARDDDGQLDAGDLDVQRLDTHVRVRSPRYLLPPDQVLSTFPPATSVGAYGARLPQVVIRRRTLPWERDLAGQPSSTPWLALVVVADDEATLHANVPVGECVTAGVELPGIADAERGTCLEIRRSKVHQLFPTKLDVPLLAHAREVDIGDTELLMGDDDGFLAVVIANRLPLPGRDEDGNEVPVRYTACLINLEGQFDVLLDEAPPPATVTLDPVVTQQVVALAEAERLAMDLPPPTRSLDVDGNVVAPLDGPAADETIAMRVARAGGSPTYAPTGGWHAARTAPGFRAARAFLPAGALVDEVADPRLRFPVLLHWSFTSAGDTTFRALMENLDSGLIGTVPQHRGDEAGRAPLQVVETGHVGLDHRTREGDLTRSWYRGPLVAHPPRDDEERLPLAHDSDQLRVAVPDGREDVGLAAAFEVGRLLALSRPAMVSSLLRWRRDRFATARKRAIADQNAADLGSLLEDGVLDEGILDALGRHLGRRLVDRIVNDPGTFLGEPLELLPPGRPLDLGEDLSITIAAGLGLDPAVWEGDTGAVLGGLRDTSVRIPAELEVDALGARDILHHGLEDAVVRLVSDTLRPVLGVDTTIGPTIPELLDPAFDLDAIVDGGATPPGPLGRRIRDRLDELLAERPDEEPDGDRADGEG